MDGGRGGQGCLLDEAEVGSLAYLLLAVGVDVGAAGGVLAEAGVYVASLCVYGAGRGVVHGDAEADFAAAVLGGQLFEGIHETVTDALRPVFGNDEEVGYVRS